jgi:hypothetical protein
LVHEVAQILAENFIEAADHPLVGVAADFPAYTPRLSVLNRLAFFPGSTESLAKSSLIRLSLRGTSLVQIPLDDTAFLSSEI